MQAGVCYASLETKLSLSAPVTMLRSWHAAPVDLSLWQFRAPSLNATRVGVKVVVT